MTAIRKVNHKHTLMTATCHGCGQAWRASEGTGDYWDGEKIAHVDPASPHGIANLRRRIKDHARRTGHEVVFHERRVVEGRVCKGG